MEAFAGENVRYGRVMGRRTINKEEIRDGRYRAAACSEFSELSVFLFLKPAASHFHISTTAFARAPSGVRKDSAVLM